MPNPEVTAGLRPHVLQVVGSLGVGGAEMMALTAAEVLRDACEMDFLVFGETVGALEKRSQAIPARVVRMGSPSSRGPIRFVRELASLLRRGHYDVVHSHVNLASGLVLLAAARARVPVRIAHSHITQHQRGSLLRNSYTRVAAALIRRYSTDMAACGDEAGLNLFGPRWKSGGVILPNGVDVDRFVRPTARRVFRAELGAGEQTTVVGMVARLVHFKNHDFMLDVMSIASTADILLVVVGEGPEREALEARVEAMGLDGRVRFLGLRDDIPDVLAGLDILAVPSHYEGLPVVLIEAQAAGLPALVSENVTRETDLGLGLLTWLPIDSPETWMTALRRAPVTRPTEAVIRERFTAAGYGASSSAKRMLAMYESALRRAQ